MKVKVGQRALVARINRALRHRGAAGQALKRTRSVRERSDLGDWHVVDLEINGVAQTHVAIDGLAKELGVLEPWEEMEGA